MSDSPSNFDPTSGDNKRVADDIDQVVEAPSSIEEEMLLEAAELEEVEYGGGSLPAEPERR